MVQDPKEALHPSMPERALRSLDPDYVLPATEMGVVLAKVTRESVDAAVVPRPSRLLTLENEITMNRETGYPPGRGRLGDMSGFTCPDCNGTLVEMEPTRFRCRVGHAWTADALLDAQTSAWERALWAAVRTLDEKVSLGRRMATFARERGSDRLSQRYERDVEEAESAAGVLRRYLTAGLVKEQPEAIG